MRVKAAILDAKGVYKLDLKENRDIPPAGCAADASKHGGNDETINEESGDETVALVLA